MLEWIQEIRAWSGIDFGFLSNLMFYIRILTCVENMEYCMEIN